jgi:hypothetical protein
MTSKHDREINLDLTFHTVEFGRHETPWDLNSLLYKGGARAKVKTVKKLIASGALGSLLCERIDLVEMIHDVINGKLVSGGSTETARTAINGIRQFFTWSEDVNIEISLTTIQRAFLDWSDALNHDSVVLKTLAQQSAYMKAAIVSPILDTVLERSTPLISLTRLRAQQKAKGTQGVHAEKQNLSETFSFGFLLQDICDGLPLDAVLRNALPVQILLRNGSKILLNSCRFPYQPNEDMGSTANALRTRYPIANLRCEAELLMFIGATGMNFAQAHQLQLRHFFYVSHIDGYQVKDRKNRKGGEVLFEIFKEYKPHFERYLAWRRELFPASSKLFPFIRARGRTELKHHQFRLRKICKDICIQFVPPRTLRNTRINWLLRRTDDPELTASMAQHSKETLLRVYEQPSQQLAISEITRFWSEYDPIRACASSVAPGQCDGKPTPLKLSPLNAPNPDCIRPSSCLWCENHRDIDSQDYVWSLASFRHLKIIEVSKWNPPKFSNEIHPGHISINRLSDKLRWFRDSNAGRRAWVSEALTRIEEGSYHRDWTMQIKSIEDAL